MGFADFMVKVRHWDNLSAKWILRHFYILFFEVVLVLIFLGALFNSLNVIDVSVDVAKGNILERILLIQTWFSVIIVILMLLNSFWLLYIFSIISGFRHTLKEISFNTGKRRDNPRPSGPPG